MFRILLLLVTTIFRCLHARRTLLRAIRIETVPVFQKASRKSESAGDFGLIDPLGHQGTLRI